MKTRRLLSIPAISMLLIVMCLLSSGCFTSYDGTYKFYELETGDGQTIGVGESYGAVVLDEDYISITLSENGKVFVNDVEVGAWDKVARNTISLSSDGQTYEFYCDGKTLKLSQGADTIVLKKE